MKARWTGPHQVLLFSNTAIKCKGKNHASHCKMHSGSCKEKKDYGWERRIGEGKHRDQLHEKGMYGTNTYMTLPYNYAPCVTRDEGDVDTVRLKRGIVLHEGITGHPSNTFLAISLRYAKSMNKSKFAHSSPTHPSMDCPSRQFHFQGKIYVGTWIIDKLTQSYLEQEGLEGM